MSWKRLVFIAVLLANALESDPALAEPISTSIAIAAATIATSVGISVATATFLIEFLISTALSVGLSYIQQAIAGKPTPPQIGIRGTLEAGEDQPRSFGVGKYVTAGTLVYANTWTKDSDHPNAFLTMVIALADIPITALNKIFVGDVIGTYSTGGSTAAGIPGYSIAEFELGSEHYLWAKFYDGTQTTADSALTTKFGSDPRYPWTSSFVGRGIPHIIFTVRYNAAIFSGFPKFKMECQGMKLYDQRLDSTEGGSGAHRFATPSTWAYSDNPIVIINNILRGIKNPTSTGYAWMYGLQTLPSIRVPSASWFAAMNECDALIHDILGVDEKQYRCGAEVPNNMQPLDAIQEFLKSCNGRMAEIGGTYKVLAGAASPSYVYSFTDDDIIITQGQDFDQFPSLDNMINAITAKYPEPAESWNMKDAPPLYDAALEAEDGGRRLVSNVTYGVVPYKSQTQRLMVSAKLEARKFRRHTIVLPPTAWGLEPNDTVQWNSTKNGYIDKLFLVEQITDNDTLDMGVVIVEIDPADYDFDPNTDYQTVVAYPVSSPGDTSLTAPLSLTVGASFKSLVLKWSNTPNFNVEVTEIWRSATSSFGGATLIAEVAPDANTWINDGLTTGTTYWYWIRYRNVSRAYSLYAPTSAGAGASNTTTLVSGTDITGSLVTDALAAAGISGVELSATLPTSGNFNGRLVFLTATDGANAAGKLYRYFGGAFTTAVPTVDLTGQIASAQITDASITSAKLGAGSVLASNMFAAAFGGALNSDPGPTDIKAWARYDTLSPIIGANVSLVTLSSPAGKVGPKALKSTGGTGVTYDLVNIPLVPVDPNKTYRGHIWYISDSGTNGLTYNQVYFYDAAQAFISGNTFLNGVAASTSWQESSVQFGAGTVLTIPSTARYMAIAVSLNYGGSTGATYAQDIRIEEALPDSLLKDGSVTTVKILDASVTTVKIGDNQVTTSKINDSSVTTSKIGNDQVTTAKILDSQVTTNKIGNDQVTTAKIGNLQITSGKLVDLAVTTAKINDAAIVASKIDALAVTTVKLDADAVTAGKLAANAVVAGKIAALTIVAGDIAANAITTAKIAAAAVVADKIAASSILASKLFVAAPGAALNSDPGPTDIGTWNRYNSITTPGTNYSVVTLPFAGKVGSLALKGTGGSDEIVNTPLVPVDPNKTYRGHMWYISDSGTNGLTYLQILYYDASQTFLGLNSSLLTAVAASTSYQETSVQFGAGTAFTIPSTARYMGVAVAINYGGTTGATYAQDIRIEEVLPSTLIADGAITTDKIIANAITAGKIATNAITAGKIAADAVTAGVIAAGAISASSMMVDDLVVTNKINGLAVTTAKIANNSVTTGVSTGAAGPTSLLSGPVLFLGGTYTASGERVLVAFDFFYDSYPGPEQTAPVIKVYRDATLVRTFVYPEGQVGAYESELFWAPGGTAGSHTWYVYGQTQGPGTDDTPVSNYNLEVKDWQK